MQALYFRLAKQNLARHKGQYGPYLLTGIVSAVVFYILASLSVRDTLGPMTESLLGLGKVVMGLFTAIFLFYTNSFLMKQRGRELGLYNVLGMSKRQIARVVFWETVFTALLMVPAGLVFGVALDKLMYMLVARLIGADVALKFEILPFALFQTALLFAVVLFLILVSNLLRVARAKPVALLQSANAGEKEPKTKIVMTVLGVGCIAGGYWMSFYSSKSAGLAIGLFFVAVVLVILGTYFLFTAGSIALLKLLRRSKSYYYRTRHFIGVSGMLYRMKQNAVGLANICILATMVLVIASSTVSLWVGQGERARRMYPADVMLTVEQRDVESGFDDVLQKELDAHAPGSGTFTRYTYLPGVAVYDEGEALTFDEDTDRFFSYSPSLDMAVALAVISEDTYTQITGETLSLGENEAAAFLAEGRFNAPVLTLFGKDYTSVPLPKTFEITGETASNILTACIAVIPDFDAFTERYTRMYDISDEQMLEDFVEVTYCIDIGGTEEDKKSYCGGMDGTRICDFAMFLNETSREHEHLQNGYSYQFRIEGIQSFREMYGSFLFMGILLGAVFSMAAVLIIYYKQLSEGTDDRARFRIMQQVGLSKQEIRRTVHSQVLTVFFLPLVTAGIHVAFAFPIIHTILRALLLPSTTIFVWASLISFAIFAVFYALTYALTARAYYRIVQ